MPLENLKSAVKRTTTIEWLLLCVSIETSAVVLVDWVVLCNSTNSGFELAMPVLLVDGYNLCGYWPKLKKHFVRGHLETARDKLVDELITFAHIKG